MILLINILYIIIYIIFILVIMYFNDDVHSIRNNFNKNSKKFILKFRKIIKSLIRKINLYITFDVSEKDSCLINLLKNSNKFQYSNIF